MVHGESSGRVLDAAEAASPVDAVEAVTRELGVALGATQVSFLIADLSGRALVRLAHVPLHPIDNKTCDETLAPGERRDAGSTSWWTCAKAAASSSRSRWTAEA